MIDVPDHTDLPDQDWAKDPVPNKLPGHGWSPVNTQLAFNAIRID